MTTLGDYYFRHLRPKRARALVEEFTADDGTAYTARYELPPGMAVDSMAHAEFRDMIERAAAHIDADKFFPFPAGFSVTPARQPVLA